MEKDKISEKDQSEYTWAKKFIAENELIFQNYLLQSFLLKKENYSLLNQSIRYSTSDANKALDRAFQEHFAELRLISQLSNELRRHAIRYDQKINLYRNRQPLILDQPINEEETPSPSLVDIIKNGDTSPLDQALKNSLDLEAHIEDPALYQAILSLTPRQKHILTASYLLNMSDTEIAAKDGVSQQSISKTRNKALEILKQKLMAEEGEHG